MNYDKLAGNNTDTVRVIGRPWPKGVSGNPSGRPNKSLMQKAVEAKFNDPEFVEKAIAAVEKTMLSGGMAGVLERKHWAERIDGPVKQEVEVTGAISMLTDEQLTERLLKVVNI